MAERGLVEAAMHDFSGGFTPRKAATEFTERQWAKLEGVVLESAAVARTQWACQRIGSDASAQSFVQVDSVGRWLVGLKADGTCWYVDYPPSTMAWGDTRALTWTQLAGVTADTSLRILCRIPLRHIEPSRVVWGLLLNTLDDSKPAYAIYEKDAGAPAIRTWTDRFPDGAPDTNVMPAANVGAMWGDFLVLGDIVWNGEGETPFRHEHAVWFSEPGDPDWWDPVNVVRTTPTGLTDRAVKALIPIDAGLLIFAASGLFLLRGNAADFDFEEVRFGIASRLVDAPCYWPATGGCAWISNTGEIWSTNGELFARLDDHLFLPRTAGANDMVRPFGHYLVAERGGRLLCFSLFDEEGAWTELVPPGDNVKSLHTIGDQLYMIAGGDGGVWRFNRRDVDVDERALTDGTAVTATVATRTLEASDGHDKTMWHRFGFRAEGPGDVLDVTVRPGPALDGDQPTMVATLNEAAATRHAKMVRGHGPSTEASAEIRLSGDVAVEQVSFWHHPGRGSR